MKLKKLEYSLTEEEKFKSDPKINLSFTYPKVVTRNDLDNTLKIWIYFFHLNVSKVCK